MVRKTQENGYSLIELLIAMAVFTIGTSVVVFLTFDANTVSRISTERTQAILLAQEGLEATRSIRDNDFSDVTNGYHGLAIENGHWIFTDIPDTIGKFTRTLSVINTTAGSGEGGISSGGIDEGSNDNGLIDVCVTAIDSNKNQNTGFGYADSFSIILKKPDNHSWTVTFDTPLVPTDDVLSDAPGLDATCIHNIALPYGRYSYRTESIINGANNWQTPKYNDQYTGDISTVNDFFTYNSNVDSDGLIDVFEDRPNRSLVLLNQLTQVTTSLSESLSIKSVTSTVSWPVNPTKNGSVQFVGYFTDWKHEQPTAGECFSVDLSNVDFEHGSSNKIIRYIWISNPSCGNQVEIKQATISWDKPSTKLTKFRINNNFLWQDNNGVSSGTIIDLDPSQMLQLGDSFEIDQMRWNKSIDDTDVEVTFIMSDDSLVTFTIPELDD